MAIQTRYSFGPVPSRRLGRSLGINNIPAKICTYSCVYCQVGRTLEMRGDRSAFYKPEDILRDVELRLADTQKKNSEPVDYLAFVPDGEPTLDRNLGKTVGLLKPLGIPVGVITNASLMDRTDVRDDLCGADWVSLKVDAVQERVWRRVDRPHPTLRLASALDGMLRFAKDFSGQLATETMIIDGVNDVHNSMDKVADFLGRLQPHTAYLSIPTRPPAEKRARVPNEDVLLEMFQCVSEKVARVELLTGYEGDAFIATGDVALDLLSITAVHPMREEAVAAVIKQSGASWEIVDGLLSSGELLRKVHAGHVYYLRRFAKTCNAL